ncbi:MAG TPA: SHOCT domain-containing protein [Rubrobacteraceae bacterium]|nr:SHOCT domain-containing protein [Rubrobacteraceae bacterium]
MMGGFGGFGMGFGIILWLAIIALIVWAVVRIFPNQGQGGNRESSAGETPEETLRRRFAGGEIDAEEYERSLKVLKGERTKGGV